MNKTIAMKLSLPLLLAGILSCAPSLACTIKGGNSGGFHANTVFEFGDLKMKIVQENDTGANGNTIGPNYSVVFDLKAPPNYLKRGVTLRVTDSFTDTICGTEVTITTSGSNMKVTAF